MGIVYHRKIGATADDLVIQLYNDAGAVQDLTGTTARVLRLAGLANIAAATEGDPTLGKLRIEASALPQQEAAWDMEVWVTFASGDVQKYPREGHDTLIMLSTLAPPP